MTEFRIEDPDGNGPWTGQATDEKGDARRVLAIPGFVLGGGGAVWGAIFMTEGLWPGAIGLVPGPAMVAGGFALVGFAFLGRTPRRAARSLRTLDPGGAD